MKPYNKFKSFQFRYEPLGLPECPYLYRWTLIIFGFSIRLHHWLRSDDNRHFHDHQCDLISLILWGRYYNVVPVDPDDPDVSKCRKIPVRAWRPWFAKAAAMHYLEIPEGGAWTLLFQSRPIPGHKWGFYVRNQKTKKFVKWRTLRYFHKFGVIQTAEYQ